MCRDELDYESTEERVSYRELIDSLTPYFTLPKNELIRFTNCLFHQILSFIREGRYVLIPYFGAFVGEHFAGMLHYNLATSETYDAPIIHQKCVPSFRSSGYASLVTSPVEAFNIPKSTVARTSNFLDRYQWYLKNNIFHKRSLMLFDNPYGLLGVNDGKYALKYSQSLWFTQEHKDEYNWLTTLFRDNFYKVDSQVCVKHVVNDLIENDNEEKPVALKIKHNYLPGIYFTGSDAKFALTRAEDNSSITRYGILYLRQQQFKDAYSKNPNVTDERPDDLTYNIDEDAKHLGVKAYHELMRQRYSTEFWGRFTEFCNLLVKALSKILGKKVSKVYAKHRTKKGLLPRRWIDVETKQEEFKLMVKDKSYRSLMALKEYYNPEGRYFVENNKAVYPDIG